MDLLSLNIGNEVDDSLSGSTAYQRYTTFFAASAIYEEVSRGDPTLSFTLKAFTPFAATKDPQGMGHFIDFVGLEDPRAPVIAVELEK